jgi:hypothetical protein
MNAMLRDTTARKIITGEYMPASKEELHAVLLNTPARQAYQIKLEGNRRRKAEQEAEEEQ